MYFQALLVVGLAGLSTCDVVIPTHYLQPSHPFSLFSGAYNPYHVAGHIPTVYTHGSEGHPVVGPTVYTHGSEGHQVVGPTVYTHGSEGHQVVPPNVYTRQGLAREPQSTAVTPNPLLAVSTYSGRGFWDCNELEQKINDERRRKGFSALLCDPHMRWTANQHLKNAEEAGFNGFNHYDSSCNLHSWFGDHQCCYTSDHSNANCMWDKPYELSKWDKREGYEISAAHSAGMSPAKAFDQWKNSSGHYAVFVPSGSGWRDIETVGCGWKNNLAHCWFSKEVPSTYN